MQFRRMEHPGLADKSFRQVPAQSDCLARCLARALDPCLVARKVAVEHRAGVSNRRISQRKARVKSDGVLEHLQRELEVLSGKAPRVALAAQVQIVSLQIFGGFVRECL